MLRTFLSLSLAMAALVVPLSAHASRFFEGFVGVNADGTVAQGGKGFSVDHFAPGRYEIDAVGAVNQCTWSITVASSNSTMPPVGFATTTGRAEEVKTIMVATYDASGEYADRGFNLIVRC